MIRVWLVAEALTLTTSCTRYVRTERLMTWSEETTFMGMHLPRGERIIVLRYVDDPGQGLIEEWNPGLRDKLVRAGTPVRVTFDCWRQFDGTFGFHIVAIDGEPYVPSYSSGPSRAGAFTAGPGPPNPLESHLPR